MLTSHPQTRDRCRVCGLVLPAWFAVAQAPNIAILLGHLSQRYHGLLRPDLDRIEAGEDLDLVVLEWFELVEEDETR
jgi:hypothetical protein